MRILLVSALLLSTAACVAPPPAPQQQGANCPPAQAELRAMGVVPPALSPPPLAPAAAAAPPPAVLPVAYRPYPFLSFSLFRRPPAAGRLTLRNFTSALADVEALATPYPDCALHPGLVPEDFKLPRNATWIIPTPPGSDVCWRRLQPGAPPNIAQGLKPAVPVAAEWNRAFTASGRSIDARL